MLFPSSLFFNDTATTEIYTLSLHDALPIFRGADVDGDVRGERRERLGGLDVVGDRALVRRDLVAPDVHAEDRILGRARGDRKSTRLNSSHANISYAVFCLNKTEPQSRHYFV